MPTNFATVAWVLTGAAVLAITWYALAPLRNLRIGSQPRPRTRARLPFAPKRAQESADKLTPEGAIGCLLLMAVPTFTLMGTEIPGFLVLAAAALILCILWWLGIDAGGEDEDEFDPKE